MTASIYAATSANARFPSCGCAEYEPLLVKCEADGLAVISGNEYLKGPAEPLREFDTAPPIQAPDPRSKRRGSRPLLRRVLVREDLYPREP
jgi:hypothetical protein